MPVGHIYPPEWKNYTDSVSGVNVQQLTDYKGHSHHFYFTNPGWYAGGRKLLFGSDRQNRSNLFSIDLESGEITQLTDLKSAPPPFETEFIFSCVNPTRDEAYFWHAGELQALDLETLERRPLWKVPDGFACNILNCSADGKYVCTGIYEDLSDRIRIDYLHGYVGFRETWEAKPLSKIMRIATDGSGADVVWEENYWIGHVNTSPTQPHLLTFCHEGPWHELDNRIWGLDMNSGKVWQIRPRTHDGEKVGHEYWHADGIHLGYHGASADGSAKLFGRIRYDNTEQLEVSFPHETGHIHSNDISLIVGDAGKVVRLWQWNGADFDGPRILCEHRSSAHIQKVHVHPRFNAAGTHVLFTSDRSGYGNLYLVEVPAFESLPELG
jgi:oligogalacturonide lyase